MGWLLRVLGLDRGHDLEELARRLGVTVRELETVRPRYQMFQIPKRSGGVREICAPDGETKRLQRRVLRKVLARLAAHEAAHGFERDRSIVTHAMLHTHKAVVVRIDVRDFFNATTAKRVERYFREIGWDRAAARRLTELTTHAGGLPQGAPTSPRISNLVNHRLDARLAGLARRFDATYSRYADDLIFSFDDANASSMPSVVSLARGILGQYGYVAHGRKKFRVLRRHHRQWVTGLVVNEGVNLPRDVRRRLRAIEHHLATGRAATLTETQMAGWRALQGMVAAGRDEAAE